MHYPLHLQKVIEHLKKFPGVGTKSAERFAFQLLGWEKDELCEMAESFRTLHTQLAHCKECGCLIDRDRCPFCTESRQASGVLCVVAHAKEVFTIEKTREFLGLYHVLGGLLSPMEGFGPDQLTLPQLKQRIEKHQIKELILAVDSTLEGDATALFLKKELGGLSLNITRLAFGIPVGSSLDYVDGGTLARALMGRETL